jgi:hypothetical protein
VIETKTAAREELSAQTTSELVPTLVTERIQTRVLAPKLVSGSRRSVVRSQGGNVGRSVGTGRLLWAPATTWHHPGEGMPR